MNAQETIHKWLRLGKILHQCGVRHVFGLPGDDLGAWYGLRSAGLTFHLANDQRQGAYQAIGTVVAGLQGLAVVVVGKGPAVTHTATAILEAREQRTPLLLLSSGVGPANRDTGAFQDLDATEALAALTCEAIRIEDPSTLEADVRYLVGRALEVHLGPVHLELPEDLPAETIDTAAKTCVAEPLPESSAPPHTRGWEKPLPNAATDYLRGLVSGARRLGLVVGGGARSSIDTTELCKLAQVWGIPIFTTASGRGVANERDPHFLGVSGLYLPEPARQLFDSLDTLIVLGSRLEETATIGWDRVYTNVLQVNILEDDLRPEWPGWSIMADAGVVLAHLIALKKPASLDPDLEGEVLNAHELLNSGPVARPSRAASVLRAMDAASPRKLVSVHENGLQDIWSYFLPYWPVGGGRQCVVPSEQTPLGFGASAALGIARAGKAPVVAFVGDGAFLTLGTEWRYLVQVDTPLVYVVFSNGGFGWLEANAHSIDPAHGGLDEAGVFCAPPGPVGPLAAAVGIPVVTLGLDDEPESAAVKAWELATSGRDDRPSNGGRAVVMDVRIQVSDVPPGFEELAGDVPSWATTGEMSR